MTTRNIKGQRLSLLLSSCPLEYLIFLLYFSRVLITSYKTLISIITAKQLFLAFPLKNDASHTQHADYTHAPPTHTHRKRAQHRLAEHHRITQQTTKSCPSETFTFPLPSLVRWGELQPQHFLQNGPLKCTFLPLMSWVFAGSSLGEVGLPFPCSK